MIESEINDNDVNAPNITESHDDRVFVLDGGFGSLLENLGYRVNDHELWSGGANIDDPDLVLKAHKLFIEAGADIIMTNTYHCSVQKMIDVKGYTLERAENVLKKAVKIAKRAIREADRKVTLVGSIGPYATYLRDGSEYSGNYTVKAGFQEQTIVSYYHQQVKPLLEASIQCLVFETISTLIEIKCLKEVIDTLRSERSYLRVWIVATCKNGTCTRGGQLFADVVRTASAIDGVQCVGINCTAPSHITSLLEVAANTLENEASPSSVAFVVYPNSGEVYNMDTRCFEGETRIEEIAAQIPRWRILGARVIGGCCRVLPKHIRVISEACRQDRKS